MRKYETTLGWIFWVLTLLGLPMSLVSLCSLLPVMPDEAQLNILSFGLNFLLTIAIFHRFLLKNVFCTLSHPGRTFVWCGIGLAIYYLGSLLVMLLISWLAPDFANANDESILTMVREHFWLMAVCIVFFVPITEETLYRGLVFGALKAKCRWAAYVVSVCVFSALHVVGYLGTLSPLHLLLSFLQYLPGGVALALVYDKTDSIWTGIMIHSTINMIAILTMR